MRKRRRRLAHQLFWNLTWRLELFTHIVPVPISIYFSAILVPMNPRQSMIAFVAGGISGVLMLVLGVLWRYVRIRRIFGRKADDLTLKKSLLHHPPLEGLVIALRWLVGVPLAHAMFIAYEGQLNLSLHSSAPFLLLIIA
ncbi:MAG: hypothetical protein KDK33_16755, partial [Leptospiraceae bacterium]|nr:hypothetical protein [Leptospiraceae bacterium]